MSTQKSQGASMLIAAFGIGFPVLLWIVILDNANENPKNYFFVYLSCMVCMGLAGLLLAQNWKYRVWWAVAGAILASALIFMV